MDPQTFAVGIRAVPAVSLPETTFYRAVDPQLLRHYGVTILHGKHTGRAGGRYNSPGSEPTLYLSGCQTVATFEREQEALITNLIPRTPPPLVVYSVRVRGARVLDLTNGALLANLGIAPHELLLPTLYWRQLMHEGQRTLPQRIGDAIRTRAGFDGILAPSWFVAAVPSAYWPATATRNLVVFMDPEKPDLPRGQAELHIFDPNSLA